MANIYLEFYDWWVGELGNLEPNTRYGIDLERFVAFAAGYERAESKEIERLHEQNRRSQQVLDDAGGEYSDPGLDEILKLQDDGK